MLARDVEVDVSLFQFILDGDVLIVTLDGKLFPRCYSTVTKQHQPTSTKVGANKRV